MEGGAAERERENAGDQQYHFLPQCVHSSELNINSIQGGGGLQPVLIISVLFILLTLVISVHVQWSVANCSVWEKGKHCRAPPTLLCIMCSFVWMLIFSDLHIFIPHLCLNHSSPPASFPFFFFPYAASHHPHLCYVTSLAVSCRNGSTENRPVTLRIQIASNARVSHPLSSSAAHSRGHTEFMSPTARATLTPGTLLS